MAGNAGTTEKSLLVIDDHREVGDFIAVAAEAAGYSTKVTTDSKGALDLCRKLRPDVVVLDIFMPDKDGIEIVAGLSSIGFDGRLLIVSGHPEDYLARVCRLACAQGLQNVSRMRKPLDARTLQGFLASTESGDARAD
jgi:CheY-like chemotaxis protein